MASNINFLLPENWRKIINEVDIDDLINIYKTGSSYYKNILDDPYTLHLLMDKWNLSEDGNVKNINVKSFKDFISFYDYNYASIRCEYKYSIDMCIENASKKGQLDWVKHYLEKNPSLSQKAFYSSAVGNQVKIGKWIYDNFNIKNHEYAMYYSIKHKSYNFIKFLLDISSDVIFLIRTTFQGHYGTINSKIANLMIDYLDKKEPNWEVSDSGFVYDLQWLIYYITINDNIEIARTYLNRFPQAIAGFYAGVSTYGLDILMKELENLVDNLNKNSIMEDALYIMLDNSTLTNVSKIIKWVIDNYTIHDYDLLASRASEIKIDQNILEYLLSLVSPDYSYTFSIYKAKDNKLYENIDTILNVHQFTHEQYLDFFTEAMNDSKFYELLKNHYDDPFYNVEYDSDGYYHFY